MSDHSDPAATRQDSGADSVVLTETTAEAAPSPVGSASDADARDGEADQASASEDKAVRAPEPAPFKLSQLRTRAFYVERVRAFKALFTLEFWRDSVRSVRAYILEVDPTFENAFTLALALTVLLFVRSPYSNFIFDEQEALLANPYVNGKELAFWQVFERDFWGLPSTRSIGSYRPVPNIIWRALWAIRKDPWLPHSVNLLIHSANAVLVAKFALAMTNRRPVAWLAGATFGCCAVLTEAITGVVGLADVLGGLGVLLAVYALSARLWLMPLAVFGALFFGYLSKESTIVATAIIPLAALGTAPLLHPTHPRRGLRFLGALVGVVAALVAYTYFRRHFFPVTMPAEFKQPLAEGEPLHARAMHEFLRWFQQPRLPGDPINNPLINADTPHRIAGALRVYAGGVFQVLFPWTLSGDYSFPQEPIPTKVVFPASVAGALALVGPPLVAFGFWVKAILKERVATSDAHQSYGLLVLCAVGLVWVPIAYFPHSNIPLLLPTVRADRFWYLPAVGSSFVVAAAAAFAYERFEHHRNLVLAGVFCFLGFQCARARMHSIDYQHDLAFWRATAKAVPNSAKAHLNYGVMLGANRNLPGRLEENAWALKLAPKWPMAHIYHGDTLCRLDRVEESWPYYVDGFKLAPNDRNLIALSLQCLWDKKAIEEHKAELRELAAKHKGSWLAFLAADIIDHGDENKGVSPKYRPRGYNEGPKDDK